MIHLLQYVQLSLLILLNTVLKLFYLNKLLVRFHLLYILFFMYCKVDCFGLVHCIVTFVCEKHFINKVLLID